MANALLAHLNEGKSASSFADRENEIYINLNKELRLLSAKEVIYGANVDEDGIAQDNNLSKLCENLPLARDTRSSSFARK